MKQLINSFLRSLSVFLVLAGVASSISISMAQGSAPAGQEMTAGEIRKVDQSTKKITIKHEEIKNLDMPAMTMVFQVKDAALLDKVKVGDKIQFRVIKELGTYFVTEIRN